MEQLGSLPAPESVLNKLKSDGTFDQLRKSCLAAIEEEPSFRAHGEHVEILSRRFLTDFNWKDGTSKNEARTRLKNYVLGVIASPELQVGMPLGALVEKALESKRKELQPKILDAVESLRVSKPPSSDPVPQPASTETTLPASSSSEVAPTKKGSAELGGLSLPFEIPGLSAPKKEPATVGGDATASKPAKGKQKTSEGVGSKDGIKIKMSDPATLKDASKSVPKVKANTTSIASKSAAVKDIGKVKEEKVAMDKETAAEDKSKTTVKSKKIKEEAVKPSAQKEEKDKEQVTASKEEKSSEVKKDTTKKELDRAEKAPSEPEDKIKEPDVQTPTEVETPKTTDLEGPVTGSRKRKQLPPIRRRSARLASKDDEKTEPESNTESKKPKDVTEAAAPSSDKDPDTSEVEDAVEDNGRKRARGEVRTSGRKKARVFLSSSEESDRESKSDEDESETECPKEEKVAKRVRGSGGAETDVTSGRKGSRKRATAQLPEESKPTKKMRKEKAKSKEKHALQRFRLKSPVVVVTRYNRRVKRNRRYSPSGELSDTESSVQEEQVEKEPEEDDSSGGEEVDSKKSQLDSSRSSRRNGRTK